MLAVRDQRFSMPRLDCGVDRIAMLPADGQEVREKRLGVKTSDVAHDAEQYISFVSDRGLRANPGLQFLN